MKKIFAIALALVMVLSMASAFASYCTAGFDWTCATEATNCGKATVEVVPYVTTNSACNEVAYVQSDCAAAIKGENVYYALKLTVPADIDTEWYEAAQLDLLVKGMVQNWDVKDWAKPELVGDDSEDGWVFYHKIGTGWFEATENDEFDVADVMNKSVVAEYAKAKVCLTLTSEDDGTAGTVGNYWVEYAEDETIYTTDYTEAEIAAYMGKVNYDAYLAAPVKPDKADAKYEKHPLKPAELSSKGQAAYDADYEEYEEDLEAWKVYEEMYNEAAARTTATVGNTIRVFDEQGGKLLVTYVIYDGKVATIDYTAWCGEAAYATIKAFFGLEIGTCVDEKIIKANFGWKEKVQSCYSWKTQNATAIVDTECVVAIPKTGDASVLAWLF